LKLKLEGKIKSLFLIIEDAENIIPSSLEDVVAEGRKTGIFLCLLTTHPTELGGKILSQMGNQIIGKTTDKEDIEYLSNMARTSNSISNLAIGEFIVNETSTNRPTKVRIK
jgi:DNA helicase HerA-like ATPase